MKLPEPKPTFAQVAAFCRIDGADYETQIALMALVAADTLQEAYELSRLPRDVFVEQITKAASFAEPRSAYAFTNEEKGGFFEFYDPKDGEAFTAVCAYLDGFLHFNVTGTNINGQPDASFYLAAMALVPLDDEDDMLALRASRRLDEAEQVFNRALNHMRDHG